MRASFTVVKIIPDRVFIADNCERGKTSVTNDAEAVVENLNGRFPGRRIVYRDSSGDWSELDHRNGVFSGFAPYDGGNLPAL